MLLAPRKASALPWVQTPHSSPKVPRQFVFNFYRKGRLLQARQSVPS
jgi:hypothetical protein